MRTVNAVIAVAVSAAIAACSTADTPTGPSGVRAPSYGVNAASPNGAWVQTQTGVCNMVGSDANGGLIGGGAGSISVKVQNNKKLMIVCKGTGIINLSGQDQIFRGFNCNVIGLKDGVPRPTTDSFAIVEADGTSSLNCTVAL